MSTNLQNIQNYAPDCIRIIPFGGCGEFGMNLTGYIVEDRLYIMDAGVSFPDSSKLGVESVYPDVGPWIKQFGGVYAYVITHGHEDHIGALPYLLENYPGPVYATPWTKALIENKLERRNIQAKYPIHTVLPGDTIKTEDFTIEYVHVNHSIPQACALYIKSSKLKILHTGDFKIDPDPIIEPITNLKRFQEIGKEGVDLLLADSTNAHIPGPSPSENDVLKPLIEAIGLAEGACFITTFASNFWRIKTIIEACQKTNRKLLVLGGGLENSMRIASDLDVFKAPPGVLVDLSTAQSLNRKQLCVVVTGSQGEWRSALMKLALGEHRQFSILPGDLCIFSSRTIPGNEKVVQTMMSLLERRGAKIFSHRDNPNIHVSGHAYRGDLIKMIEAIQPKTFIPIHGSFSHLISNGRITKENVTKVQKTLLIENGDILDVTTKGSSITDRIDVNVVYVDSESYESVGYDVLRERLKIGELGLVNIAVSYTNTKNSKSSKAQCSLVGLSAKKGKTKAQIEAEFRKAAEKSCQQALSEKVFAESELSERIRLDIRRVAQNIYGKKPVVLIQLISASSDV